MSDRLSFEQRFAELVKTHRAMFKQPKPESLDARVLGLAEDGQYYIMHNGNRIVRGSSTTGAIAVDQCVTYRGFSIDAQRAGPVSKPKPQQLYIPPRKTSAIKFLFSVTSGGSTQLFVGGDRPNPSLVGSFTAGSIAAAILDNLGGSNWSVDLVLNNSGSYTFQQITSSGAGAAIAIPTPDSGFKLYGYGLASVSQTTASYTYPRIYPVDTYIPIGLSSYSDSASYSITDHVVVNGALIAIAGSGSVSGTNSKNFFIPGNTTTYATDQSATTTISEPSIPLTNNFSYTRAQSIANQLINSYSAIHPSQPNVVITTTVSQTIADLKRTNGLQSIALYHNFSGITDGSTPGNPAFVNDAIAPATGLSSFDFSGNLDVHADGFTSFSLDFGSALMGAEDVMIQKYGTDFEAIGSPQKVTTVKQTSVPSGSLQFFNASYHS